MYFSATEPLTCEISREKSWQYKGSLVMALSRTPRQDRSNRGVGRLQPIHFQALGFRLKPGCCD